MAIRERALGPEHPDVAWSLSALGFMIERQGHFAQVRPFYERASTINEKVFGPEHHATATTIHSLGRLLHSQGDYARARLLSAPFLLSLSNEGVDGRNKAGVTGEMVERG